MSDDEVWDEADDDSFEIWHPTFILGVGDAHCRMDVTALALYQLGEGDVACMETMLRSLKIQFDEIVSWRVQRFCSPYYVRSPGGDEWEDRVPLVWRVAVDFRTAKNPPHYLPGSPFATGAFDSTFEYAPASYERGGENCVVLADARVRPNRSFVESLPGYVEILDYATTEGELFQVRIDLGTLDLPRDMDKVDSVMAACRAEGLSTSWDADMPGP